MTDPAENAERLTWKLLALRFREFRAAVVDAHSYSPWANSYLLYGFLWGVPVPLVTLGLELSLRGLPATPAGIASALADHPVQVVFLLHPLLFAWIFGVLGTMSREKDLRISILVRDLTIQATRDAMTGLLNRRHLLDHLDVEVERARREAVPLACLMVDMDNLKLINDTSGHLAGDSALIGLAEVIRQAFRPYDLAGRYGGDEFLLVLPHVGLDQAVDLALRFRERVRGHDFALPPRDRAVRPSVSVGIAVFPADGQTPSALIASADGAMYQAKTRGKDRIACASGPDPWTPPGVEARRAGGDPCAAAVTVERGPRDPW
ncbi:MAG: GGDEF domain-containing protein [Planctomycetes bacterium]|nr:GGDEF domain-containing protein [Planctomycetota bacterium]